MERNELFYSLIKSLDDFTAYLYKEMQQYKSTKSHFVTHNRHDEAKLYDKLYKQNENLFIESKIYRDRLLDFMKTEHEDGQPDK